MPRAYKHLQQGKQEPNVRNFIYCKNEEQHMIVDFCASQTVH